MVLYVRQPCLPLFLLFPGTLLLLFFLPLLFSRTCRFRCFSTGLVLSELLLASALFFLAGQPLLLLLLCGLLLQMKRTQDFFEFSLGPCKEQRICRVNSNAPRHKQC
jgi:hypothetical protein